MRTFLVAIVALLLSLAVFNLIRSRRTTALVKAFSVLNGVSSTKEKDCTSREDHGLLIYNRMPKCGSTSTFEALYTLAKDNFHLEFSDRYYPTATEIPTEPFLVRAVNASRHGQKAVYVNHFWFPGSLLQAFTSPVNVSPMYMQIVREPVARFLSQFHFLSDPGLGKYYRWNRQRLQNQAGWENPTRSINECISQAKYPRNCEQTNEMTHYFCGYAPECADPSTGEALDLALSNVNHYVFVGVLEHLSETFSMLEMLLPSFFGNVSNIEIPHSNSAGKSSYSNITTENLELLKQWNANDIKLYDVILKLFHERTSKCLKTKDV